MALPADLSTVEVIGTFVDYNGQPLQGTIEFTATARVVSEDTHSAVLPSTVVGVLDANGELKANDGTSALRILATDDPDGTPTGWTWTVVEKFTGRDEGTPYHLQAPAAGGPINLPVVSLAATPPTIPAGSVAVTQINNELPNTTGRVTLSAADIGAAADDDPRLSDARTPALHASSHAPNGSDPLTPAQLGAATPSDILTALAGHVDATDPHPQYLLQPEGDSRYVRTVNGTAPDTAGNVTVATGGQATQYRNVASRSNSNSNPGSGTAGLPTVQNAHYRTTRRVLGGAAGVNSLKLAVGNFYVRQWERGEQPGPNAITVRASIEYPAGTWRMVSSSYAYSASQAYAVGDQVTYNGNAYVCIRGTAAGTAPTNTAYWTQVQRVQVTWPGQGANNTITVPGGSTDANVPAPVAYSDPITLPVPLQPGQKMAINLAVGTGSSSGKVCPGDLMRPVGDFFLNYGATMPAAGSATDLVTQWPTTQANGGTTWSTPMVMPVAVLGSTSKPCTYLLGDSIIEGNRDDDVLGDTNSWGPRVLDGYLWEKSGRGGGWAAHVWRDSDSATEVTSYIYRLDDVAARCQVAVTAFGTNEISDTTTTLQGFKDMLFTLWRRLAAKGCRVWQTTITPQTTSTDNWATTANQAKPSSGGFSGTTTLYSQVQSWLASGAPYTINGITVAAGQAGHPLAGVLDVAAAVIDPATGWKWKAGNTADGVHPNGTGYAAMAAQFKTLLPQVEADLAMFR